MFLVKTVSRVQLINGGRGDNAYAGHRDMCHGVRRMKAL